MTRELFRSLFLGGSIASVLLTALPERLYAEAPPTEAPPTTATGQNHAAPDVLSSDGRGEERAALAVKAEKASRSADNGCAWKSLNGTNPPLELFVEECVYGERKITFRAGANAISQHYSDAPDGAEPERVIEVYAKEPAERPAAVLKRLFVSKLDAYEQQHCVPRPAKADEMEKPFASQKKTAWVIAPDATYAAKIRKETPEGEMPEETCGEYGAPVDSRAYFEFHSDSPATFAWVVIGQDTPLFDEQSLAFER